MDAQHDPTPEPDRARADDAPETEHMQVRRSPKYGAFMAVGALVGAVVGWWLSANTPAAIDPSGEAVDTTPVVGLMLVVGFFVGGSVGALVAVILDRALSKRLTPVEAERVEVRGAAEHGAPADGVERAEHPEAVGQTADDLHVADASRGGAADAEAPLEAPREDDPPREDDLPRGA